ncbi:MAG TPA: helix-turn-helix domain-containing protein [Polyangiaceae bacterium]|nr:helix-turn-helix domain-containing protein [Polyangiaceae bacterium]
MGHRRRRALPTPHGARERSGDGLPGLVPLAREHRATRPDQGAGQRGLPSGRACARRAGRGGRVTPAALVGARVRELRIALGWSQRELGRRVGVSHAAVCQLERGHHGCTLARIVRYAEALRVSPTSILTVLDSAGADVPTERSGPTGDPRGRGRGHRGARRST